MSGSGGYLVVRAECTGDGRWLATGGDDGCAHMWPLKREDLLRAARNRVTRDFTEKERDRYSALLAK